MEMKLVFLGYTNRPVETNSSSNGTTRAVGMATSSRAVDAEVSPPAIRGRLESSEKPADNTLIRLAADQRQTKLVLKPGESFSFELATAKFDKPWVLGMWFTKLAPRDKLHRSLDQRFENSVPRWLNWMVGNYA